MFGVGPATRIYLAAGATDMRKGCEGLYGLVRDQLRLEPLSGHIFLCLRRSREVTQARFPELTQQSAGLGGHSGKILAPALKTPKAVGQKHR